MQNITEEEVKSLGQRKAELEIEINAKHNRIGVLATTINELELKENSFKDNSKEAKEIETQLESLRSTRDELQKIVASLADKINDIERISNTLESQKKLVEDNKFEISSLESKKKTLISEVDLAKAVVSSLEKDALTMRKNNEIEYDTHRENHLNNKSAADLELAVKKDEIAKANAWLIEVTDQKSIVLQKLEVSVAELKINEKDLEKLRNDVSELTAKKDNLSKIISDTFGAKEIELTTLKEKLDTQERDLETRESNLSFRSDIVEKRADTLKDIKSQLEQIHGRKINITI